jgi:preprotein translocase subunit SecG
MVLLAFSFLGFLKSFLMLLFVLSSLLLMLVVLLQEPKGGGLSSAFGGAGAETFGVQTGSVNKFTAYVAAIFMGSALLYAAIRLEAGSSVLDTKPAAVAPENPGGGAQPPGGNNTQPPGGGAPAGGGAQPPGGGK